MRAMQAGRIPYPADRCKHAKPERAVDFSALLFDLRRARWSVVAIARTLDLARTSVRNYASGETWPMHPAGELIILLWCQQTGKSRERTPMRPIYRARWQLK
jgi:hypothetical protein